MPRIWSLENKTVVPLIEIDENFKTEATEKDDMSASMTSSKSKKDKKSTGII